MPTGTYRPEIQFDTTALRSSATRVLFALRLDTSNYRAIGHEKQWSSDGLFDVSPGQTTGCGILKSDKTMAIEKVLAHRRLTFGTSATTIEFAHRLQFKLTNNL